MNYNILLVLSVQHSDLMFCRLHTIPSYNKIEYTILPVTYFIAGSLYLLKPFTWLTSPSTHLIWQQLVCSLWVCVLLHLFIFFLGSTYKQRQKVFFWLISIMLLGISVLLQIAKLLSYNWIIFHCRHHIFFIHSFVWGMLFVLKDWYSWCVDSGIFWQEIMVTWLMVVKWKREKNEHSQAFN